jgi:ribose 5-phosphate isomerase A
MAAAGAVSDVESAKRAASILAVDGHVRSDTVVGVGSGSTVVYAIERLSERTKLADIDPLRLRNMTFVPTSFQSRQV